MLNVTLNDVLVGRPMMPPPHPQREQAMSAMRTAMARPDSKFKDLVGKDITAPISVVEQQVINIICTHFNALKYRVLTML